MPMTTEERAATSAFYRDLLSQWRANSQARQEAKDAGDLDRYNECVEETRRLYREIKEVDHALVTNVLPF